VKINLIVRGVCSLRPGIKSVSENISVRSVVGRFLEHTRVFYFSNDGNPELYLSSADLMGRNLDRRVELIFPIEAIYWQEIMKREALDILLRDNVRARALMADGTYVRVQPTDDEQLLEAQSYTIESRLQQQNKSASRDNPGKTP
jgi:polyphosphate kinase